MDKFQLENIFKTLVSRYTDSNKYIQEFWSEIEYYYSDEKRVYHNKNHLSHFFEHYLTIKNTVIDTDSFLFAMFYHDIIYDSSRRDNEQKSSELGLERLKKLAVPIDIIKKVEKLILATKSHSESEDNDCKLFIDCDLAILGSDLLKYSDYYQAIRQEYYEVPDFLYIHGRSEVLKSFLNKKNIYNTDYFKKQLEKSARTNLETELKILDSKKENNQYRLFKLLEKVLNDKQAEEFVYEWEWETWFEPTQTIEVEGKSIHTEYDLYFEFGEKDIDEIAKVGFYEKINREINSDHTLIRVNYKKVHNTM